MVRICKKLTAGLLALCLLTPLSCGKPVGSDGDGLSPEDAVSGSGDRGRIVLEPAVPAVGVGRIMPVGAGEDRTPASSPADEPAGAPGTAAQSYTVPQAETETWAEEEPRAEDADARRLICVDPGHGFADPGTGGDSFLPEGVYERDITILVSGYLVDALEERGFRVVTTHDGETIPPGGDLNGDGIFSAPYERPPYINTYIQPDYLVSIHVNAVGYAEKCGAQVYYEQNWNKVNDWSKSVASSIRDAIDERVETTAITQLINSDEMADSSFAINRETTCAASLIEMGFCTNEDDAANLIDPAWQKQMAEAIAEGIRRFFDGLDDN